MKKTAPVLIILILLASLLKISPPEAYSQDTEKVKELQTQINQKNQDIEQILEEIKKYEAEIDKLQKEGKGLQGQIKTLEATVAKLKAQINLTEKNITAANLTIEQLNYEIKEKNRQISEKKETLAETLRRMDEEETKPLIEILLANSSLSDFWNNLERLEYLQKDISFNLEDLKNYKNTLESQERQKEEEKNNLETLYGKLADQKKITDSTNIQKKTLLTQTKSKEIAYKKLLAEQLEKQNAMVAEIDELENQLRIEINPDTLPPTGSGVLQWPVDKPFVTQYFGDTPFATQNPQVYGGKGHPGIDLRAAVGTPVKSARTGVITATGNTISYCRGYQIGYGKWVLIKHNNNLSTFYSHLSLIKVSAGDTVNTGQLIGYSGDTGYTKGPHLHFGVFATQAIDRLKYVSTSATCGGITMHQPIVAPSGYLNPLSYL